MTPIMATRGYLMQVLIFNPTGLMVTGYIQNMDGRGFQTINGDGPLFTMADGD